jgi:hypothetical protein
VPKALQGRMPSLFLEKTNMSLQKCFPVAPVAGAGLFNTTEPLIFKRVDLKIKN